MKTLSNQQANHTNQRTTKREEVNRSFLYFAIEEPKREGKTIHPCHNWEGMVIFEKK
jgi:hypothetical protein